MELEGREYDLVNLGGKKMNVVEEFVTDNPEAREQFLAAVAKDIARSLADTLSEMRPKEDRKD